MTIDEAIKNAEKLAELNEEQAQIYKEQGDTMGSWSYEECAKEHRQLAEWLRELKDYREHSFCKYCREEETAFTEEPCKSCKNLFVRRR